MFEGYCAVQFTRKKHRKLVGQGMYTLSVVFNSNNNDVFGIATLVKARRGCALDPWMAK